MARLPLEAHGEASFPSCLESTPLLLDWFEQHHPAWVDPLLWIQAQTALVEGFTNAVRHAHAALTAPPAVVVALEVTAEHLQLRLRDQGPPFDITPAWSSQGSPMGELPAAVGEPALPELPLREAHWGLVMLARLRRDFGWSISYDPLPEGGNILILARSMTGVPPG
jgi:serine/threonine-protein kinase RsbW